MHPIRIIAAGQFKGGRIQIVLRAQIGYAGAGQVLFPFRVGAFHVAGLLVDLFVLFHADLDQSVLNRHSDSSFKTL